MKKSFLKTNILGCLFILTGLFLTAQDLAAKTDSGSVRGTWSCWYWDWVDDEDASLTMTYQFWGVELDEYGMPATHGDWVGTGPCSRPDAIWRPQYPSTWETYLGNPYFYNEALDVILYKKYWSLSPKEAQCRERSPRSGRMGIFLGFRPLLPFSYYGQLFLWHRSSSGRGFYRLLLDVFKSFRSRFL